jgi:WD40 repeat protein
LTVAGHVALYDLSTGRHVGFLSGLPWDVLTCGAFSPDGRRLAVGFHSGQVGLWDAATGKRLRPLAGLRHRVTALAFSADGRSLAAASRADLDLIGDPAPRKPGEVDQVLIWDAATGRRLGHLTEQLAEVNSLAWSPDGQRLVTGSGKRAVRLWDVSAGRPLAALSQSDGPGNSTSAVACSGDGHRVAALTGDNRALVFDAHTGQRVFLLEGHRREVQSLAFSPDGRRLATAGGDATVRLWDLTTGLEVLTWPAPNGLEFLSFASDGLRLLAVWKDGSVRIWDAAPVGK